MSMAPETMALLETWGVNSVVLVALVIYGVLSRQLSTRIDSFIDRLSMQLDGQHERFAKEVEYIAGAYRDLVWSSIA